MAVYFGSQNVNMMGGSPITTTGINTSDATATASDILSGKTAYVNGSKVTGTIPSQAAQTITPGTSDQTIVSGKYLSGTQTIKGDSNLVASNIKSGVSIFGVNGNYTGNGTDTSDATATTSDIASGKTAYINGELVTGTIKEGNPTHRAGTPSYNPTTYVNLISIKATSNEDAIIRSGSEFSATASASEFGNATVNDVAKGKTFTSVNGLKLTGTHECSSSSSTPTLQSKSVTPSESSQTVKPDSGYDGLSQVTVGAISSTYVGSGITKKAATTYTPSTSNQTIASGTYLSGIQTIKGDANLIASNIKSGVSIFGVSGNYAGSSSGSSDNNCEAYYITSTSATLNFKNTGTVKVYGYGYKSSTYSGTMYSFVGDGYYTSGRMYGTPSKTSATFSISSSGTLSGLPSGLTTVNLLVEIGV